MVQRQVARPVQFLTEAAAGRTDNRNARVGRKPSLSGLAGGCDQPSMETLTKHFTLGEPQVAGPLAVFPVFGPEPRLHYRAFAQASELGAFVKELDGGASVRELVLHNPTDLPLLVYEGEELLGAQQNRTLDASVLIAAGKHATLN